MAPYKSYDSKVLSLIEFDESIIQRRKLRILLPAGFLLLFILFFITLVFTPGFSIVLALILVFWLLSFCVSGFLASKFFNWPLLSFFVVILGIFFKRQHWPMASLMMAVGTLFLGAISIFNSLKIPYEFRNNTFLKWFGSLTGIIVALFMTGLLYMNLHWSGVVRMILIYLGLFLFFLTVLSMVFTLPFSNYVAWPDLQRKVFFRAVLIPMAFIFVFFVLVFVFPDTYNSLLGRSIITPPWYFFDVELFNLEGIPSLLL